MSVPALVRPTDITSAPAPGRWDISKHIKDVQAIFDLHQYRRPDCSWSENRFIRKFIYPLGMKRDAYSNFYKLIGPEQPKFMWSCHTDTVHSCAGFQSVVVDGKKLKLSAIEKASNCLGADDGAGVWMLLEMIKAGIPGLYIFHRNEEHGCQGSKHFLKQQPELVRGIQAAITFDRRGKKDIITHQMSVRTCSDAFAKSLASALNMGHAPCDGGAYTDTEAYKKVIPECTNVAAGYDDAHWKNEHLDLQYLIRLRDAVLKMDLDSLVIERDPSVVEERKAWGGRWKGNSGWENDYTPHRYGGYSPPYTQNEPTTVLGFVHRRPNEVVAFLEDLGVTAKHISDYIKASNESLPGPSKSTDNG